MNEKKYEIINNNILKKYETSELFFDYIDSLDITKENNIDTSTVIFENNMIYLKRGQRTTMSSEKNYSLGQTQSTCIFRFSFPIKPRKIIFSGRIASYHTTFFRFILSDINKKVILLGQTNPSGVFLDGYRKYENVVDDMSIEQNCSIEQIPFNFNNEYDISNMNFTNDCMLSFYSPSVWNIGVCNGIYIRTLEIIC